MSTYYNIDNLELYSVFSDWGNKMSYLQIRLALEWQLKCEFCWCDETGYLIQNLSLFDLKKSVFWDAKNWRKSSVEIIFKIIFLHWTL